MPRIHVYIVLYVHDSILVASSTNDEAGTHLKKKNGGHSTVSVECLCL